VHQNEQALDAYNHVLLFTRAVGDRFGEAAALNNIGEVYVDEGQYSRGLNYLSQALDITRNLGDPVEQTIVLSNHGLANERLGNRSQALDDYRQAVTDIETVLNAAALDSAVASLTNQDQNRSPYQRLAVLLTQDGKFDEALSYAERGRAVLVR